jgi:hypothetical protein
LEEEFEEEYISTGLVIYLLLYVQTCLEKKYFIGCFFGVLNSRLHDNFYIQTLLIYIKINYFYRRIYINRFVISEKKGKDIPSSVKAALATILTKIIICFGNW